MSNAFFDLVALLPASRLESGVVAATDGVTALVELPDGRQINARNAGGYAAGAAVFVRGGAIEGAAPALVEVRIEV
jgi:hypothetical protein